MPEASRQKTVLLVEDNALNMKLAAELLTLNGFEVLRAFDGESALQTLKERRADVVLLDLHLPGMDGFEVFKQIKGDPRTHPIKVVALTASAMREEEEQIMDLGFDDYIAKPIDTKRFVKKVQELTRDTHPPHG